MQFESLESFFNQKVYFHAIKGHIPILPKCTYKQLGRWDDEEINRFIQSYEAPQMSGLSK